MDERKTIYLDDAMDAIRKAMHADIDYMSAIICDGIEDVLNSLPSAQPYTEEQLQKLQDLEQAQLEEAYKRGYEEGQGEIIHCCECKYWKPGYITDDDDFVPPSCAVGWVSGVWRATDYCSNAERKKE